MHVCCSAYRMRHNVKEPQFDASEFLFQYRDLRCFFVYSQSVIVAMCHTNEYTISRKNPSESWKGRTWLLNMTHSCAVQTNSLCVFYQSVSKNKIKKRETCRFDNIAYTEENILILLNQLSGTSTIFFY
jgi:hypothetical protein